MKGGLGVGSPLRTDQKPVPNCRAFGPGNLNPAFGPFESCSGQNQPNTGPGSPVRGPEALLRNRKSRMRLTFGRLWNYIFIGLGGFHPDPIPKTLPCPRSTPKGLCRPPRDGNEGWTRTSPTCSATSLGRSIGAARSIGY